MSYGHGVANPSYRKRTSYQAMLLGGMAALASAMLVLGDLETRDAIAQRKAEDLQASLSQVVPASQHDNNLLEDIVSVTPDTPQAKPVEVYRAHLGEEISAVAFKVSAIGYAGPITSIMAVDDQGEVLGVRVLSHAETPGLGDKIEIARDDWILDFNGHTLANTRAAAWHVKKDGGEFDQFTGATITPRAVVKSVYQGLQLFEANREQLLAAPKKPQSSEESADE